MTDTPRRAATLDNRPCRATLDNRANRRFAEACNNAKAYLRTCPLGWSALVLTDEQDAGAPGWLLLPPGQPPPAIRHVLLSNEPLELDGPEWLPLGGSKFTTNSAEEVA